MNQPTFYTITYSEEVFRQNVELSVGGSVEFEKYNLKRGLYIKIPDDSAGHATIGPGEPIQIWLPRLDLTCVEDICNLSHECLHAADFVLSRIGHKRSQEASTDETTAYFFESMLRFFMTEVNSLSARFDPVNISIYHPVRQ